MIRNGALRQFGSLPQRLNDSKTQTTSISPNSNAQNKPRPPSNENTDSTSPAASSSPQAYSSTDSKQSSGSWSLITSEDWHQFESSIPPEKPRDWLDSDGPVPLNKNLPLSEAEFRALPRQDQRRLLAEDFVRLQHDYVRGEKLYDHTHLHPFQESMVMPMVAPHRNYAPEGAIPPPLPHIPWQMRRPWVWLAQLPTAFAISCLFLGVLYIALPLRARMELQGLERNNPAPSNWPNKARDYYIVALHHKKEGETQLAVWALQRALVEAGYRWIVEPEQVPDGERTSLDIPTSLVIQRLIKWEVALEHWDRALSLMKEASVVYADETPANMAHRSEILRLAAIPTEKVQGVDAASNVYQRAISYATSDTGFELPASSKDPIILPTNFQGNALLLRTLEEYTVFQIRNGIKSTKEALSTLLSIEHAYANTPYPKRDLCGQAQTQLHIGELMYTLGHLEESFQWTDRAVKIARTARPLQKKEEEQERCLEVLSYGCNSLGLLYEVPRFCC